MFSHLKNLTFQQAGIGSSLFHSFINKDLPNLNWINGYPDEVDFNVWGQERLSFLPDSRRTILVQALLNQYALCDVPDTSVEDSIEKLAKHNSLCVTTGHQLGFGAGPLFLLYKIASVVTLARQLNEQNHSIHVVPVFWMNSDDHDLAEVSSFYWEKKPWTIPILDNRGPVGDYCCPEMPDFWDQLRLCLPEGAVWSDAFHELKSAYQPGIPLGMAFRRLIAKWTKGSGLIILDQQDPTLKACAWAYMSTLLEQDLWYSSLLSTTQEQESAGFAPQVKPLPNLFFFHSALGRERIEKQGPNFVSHQSKTTWSSSELKSQMANEPQLFSTNVTGRSIYQEFILPNMAYIGGAAEIRYWMQFSGMFRSIHLPFPVLVPRESFLLLSKHEVRILNKLNLNLIDLFGKREKMIQKWIRGKVDAYENDPWNEVLNSEGLKWAQIFASDDPSLFKAVLAKYKVLNNEMKALNSKRLRSLKKREQESLLKIEQLFDWVQPTGILQERIQHPWFLGPQVEQRFQELLSHSNPLENQVVVLEF